MRGVRGESGWRGLSVTMPLKTAMVAEVDEVRGIAGVLGVVNTVAFEDDGAGLPAHRLQHRCCRHRRRHPAMPGRYRPRAVMLGGGGTAAAAVAALRDLGAGTVPAVRPRHSTGRRSPRSSGGAWAWTSRCVPLSELLLPRCGCRRRHLHPPAARRRRPGRRIGRARDRHPGRPAGRRLRSLAQPDRRGVAGRAAVRWSRAWRCCCTRRWSRCGFLPAAGRKLTQLS